MKNKTEIKKQITAFFGEEYLINLVSNLGERVSRYIYTHFLENYIFISYDLFEQSFFEAMYDLMKDNSFNDVDVYSETTQYAYIASWWLKRKPLQIKENSKREPIFVNERFINEFLLLSLKYDLKNNQIYNQKKAAVLSLKLLNYLKYEDANPKMLELFLLGLNTIN